MTNDNTWSPCEDGTLENLSENLRRKERQQQVTRRSLFSALAVTGLGAVYLAVKGQVGEVAGIACSLVHKHSASYVNRTADATLIARIDAHRQHCSECDSFLTQLES